MAPPTNQTPQEAEDIALASGLFDDEQTSTEPRNSPPTECSKWGDKHAFRVWWLNDRAVRGSDWICVASFFFLSDCLDYITSCQDKGVDVVYQSPAHTHMVMAKDNRIVWKAPTTQA